MSVLCIQHTDLEIHGGSPVRIFRAWMDGSMLGDELIASVEEDSSFAMDRLRTKLIRRGYQWDSEL